MGASEARRQPVASCGDGGEGLSEVDRSEAGEGREGERGTGGRAGGCDGVGVAGAGGGQGRRRRRAARERAPPSTPGPLPRRGAARSRHGGTPRRARRGTARASRGGWGMHRPARACSRSLARTHHTHTLSPGELLSLSRPGSGGSPGPAAGSAAGSARSCTLERRSPGERDGEREGGREGRRVRGSEGHGRGGVPHAARLQRRLPPCHCRLRRWRGAAWRGGYAGRPNFEAAAPGI